MPLPSLAAADACRICGVERRDHPTRRTGGHNWARPTREQIKHRLLADRIAAPALPQLAVACPHCGAPAGQPCTGRRYRGQPVHQARRDAFADAPTDTRGPAR